VIQALGGLPGAQGLEQRGTAQQRGTVLMPGAQLKAIFVCAVLAAAALGYLIFDTLGYGGLILVGSALQISGVVNGEACARMLLAGERMLSGGGR
jgi:hypothetical protein